MLLAPHLNPSAMVRPAAFAIVLGGVIHIFVMPKLSGFWELGVLLAILVIGGTLGARQLNVLARGELQAAIVGLPVRGFRHLIFAAASLATALAVTSVGVIGFIGLVVPHLVRLVAGSDHRVVLPASALAGGALLVVAGFVFLLKALRLVPNALEVTSVSKPMVAVTPVQLLT